MRTPLENIENTVTYHTKGGREYDDCREIPKEEEVLYGEVRYYCPYCDSPNVCTHSPPLPKGLIDHCSHCDRENKIIGNDKSNNKNKYHIRRLEEFAREMEKKRNARLVGERQPKSVKRQIVSRFVLEPLWGISVASLLFLLPLTFLLMLIMLYLLNFVAAFTLAVILFATLWGLKKSQRDITSVDEWIAGGIFKHTPRGLVGRGKMLKHGRKIDEEKEELYIPKKSLDEDEVEKELELEKETK